MLWERARKELASSIVTKELPLKSGGGVSRDVEVEFRPLQYAFAGMFARGLAG